jgi:competence protein ComEA
VVRPRPGRHAARRGERWSPGALLAGRAALGPAQVAVVAVLVAAGLALTAWWVVRDDGAAVPVEPMAAPGLASPGPSVPAPTASASPSGEVVVDVAGKVRRPGIVVLDPGARVVDALEAAGGARAGVDLAGLNLARLLVDGEQIVVGVPAPPGPAASAAGTPAGDPGALVNLNSAGNAELEELPGVGPVTAQAIVDWRAANGGFRSVDQLLDVDGIGEKTLEDLAPLVTV